MMLQTLKHALVCATFLTMFQTTSAENFASVASSSRMVETLAAELAPKLARVRYMEVNPKPVIVPGWEGFPTVECTYTVRGIVYEDYLPANGINKVFCFRDGVTVKIKGVDHRSEKQPSPAQIEKSLTATINDVTWVGKYARIQSTTREEYKAAGGLENVDGTNWLEVSRRLYQQAWNSETNELMTAWMKANL